jgi:hypothetical protein
MKLQFKIQQFQTAAVDSVVQCFSGQANTLGIVYRIDPGSRIQASLYETGFKNADLMLSDKQVLVKYPGSAAGAEPSFVRVIGDQCRLPFQSRR